MDSFKENSNIFGYAGLWALLFVILLESPMKTFDAIGTIAVQFLMNNMDIPPFELLMVMYYSTPIAILLVLGTMSLQVERAIYAWVQKKKADKEE